ncbi:MAG TPA: biotin transporter BioY [Gemmatimonadales bacterium]|nr:biotin transporter BioY [Gemmatimonadales bacterium]
MTTKPVVTEVRPLALLARRTVAVLLGAALVALSAQVEVPLPLTQVPMTLQGLAVLAVGGLLGPGYGAASLVTYLAMGIGGLPVFAGGSAGAWKLLGPTGGYLLAFPVAAAVVGALGPRGSVGAAAWRGIPRAVGAALVGMVIIHAGGVAQLAILTGDPRAAVTLGTAPFLAVDLVKVVLAGVLIARFAPTTRRVI